MVICRTEEAEAVMNQIMRGEASDAQIGAYLMALRMKGETIDEIVGSARAMRANATTSADQPAGRRTAGYLWDRGRWLRDV